MENSTQPKSTKPAVKGGCDFIKILSYIGIGALFVCGFASIIASFIPPATFDYAILGVICLTSAATLLLLFAISSRQGKCHGASAGDDSRVAVLEAQLERERAILGSLFELTEYPATNRAFREKRKAQFEAKKAIDQIKALLERIDEITDGEVRAQYMYQIEEIIAQYNEAIADEDDE